MVRHSKNLAFNNNVQNVSLFLFAGKPEIVTEITYMYVVVELSDKKKPLFNQIFLFFVKQSLGRSSEGGSGQERSINAVAERRLAVEALGLLVSPLADRIRRGTPWLPYAILVDRNSNRYHVRRYSFSLVVPCQGIE